MKVKVQILFKKKMKIGIDRNKKMQFTFISFNTWNMQSNRCSQSSFDIILESVQSNQMINMVDI